MFVEWIANGYTNAMLDAIAGAAEHADCDLVCFVGGLDANDFPSPRRDHPLAYASAENLDGVLVVSLGNFLTSHQIAQAMAPLASLPMCAIAVRWDEYTSVEVDNDIGVYLGVEHLIKVHGRRRIACIRGPENSAEAQTRYAAYRRALAEHGLSFDPNLVITGDFVIASGRDAVRSLLDDRRVEFDAIVAANDSMALGAMRELIRREIGVPEQVAVLGFDDMPEARHAQPPLSTVRQPIAEHAEVAFEQLLAQVRGERVPTKLIIPSELVLRRSCGCLEAARRPASSPPTPSRWRTKQSYQDLVRRWFQPVAHYLSAGDPHRHATLLALLIEGASAQRPSHGLRALGRELDRASREDFDMLRALPIVREIEGLALRDLAGTDKCKLVLDLCGDLGALIAETVGRQEATLKHLDERLFSLLLRNQRALAETVSLREVQQCLADCLGSFGIDSCFLCLYEGDTIPASTARVMLAASPSREIEIPARGVAFSTKKVLPDDFMPCDRRSALIQYPLFLAETGARGYVVIERGAVGGFVHDALAQQIFGSYRRIELMDRLIHEARRREAAERQRLEREMRIATSIQTGILPRQVEVQGLEISALMAPATEVGGDYYDVIPHADGCWFGIGDVAGHGLSAGLVMLMLQSAIGGLTRQNPSALPSEVLPAVNDLLVDNIRCRLLSDEHITLTLLRYHRSGRIVHAGAHEDILVHRASTGRVERIQTPGTWLGISAELGGALEDHEFVLESGDVMLLFTDGITEARNRRDEMFGLQRLTELLLRHAGAPVQSICDTIVSTVQDWTAAQDDDVTVLVAKQL